MTLESREPTANQLAEQREDLQRQLHLKRLRMQNQLMPDSELPAKFPRSQTMRLLTRHPVLAGRLLKGLLGLLKKTRRQ